MYLLYCDELKNILWKIFKKKLFLKFYYTKAFIMQWYVSILKVFPQSTPVKMLYKKNKYNNIIKSGSEFFSYYIKIPYILI